MSQQITDSNFAQIINSNRAVVVDFNAIWCGPCKAISPIIDELSREYSGKAVVGKLDIDRNPQTAQQMGVRNVPTILFFKNGQLVDRHVGGAQKSVLAQKINSLL